MIFVITGEIGIGKTSQLLSIYNELQVGEGFAIKKVYTEGIYVGQEVVRLSTGECKPFSFKKAYLSQNWDEVCTWGPYSFSGEGFSFASNIITNALHKKIQPLYFDEIGPLELQGKGFSNILSTALAGKNNMYITIRESCLHAIIKKFNIPLSHLLKVS